MLSLMLLACSQKSSLTSIEPPPSPPPPVKKEEKPATPQRIRVGSNVQAAYQGPAAQWVGQGAALSDAQIAELQQALAKNPEDVCARAYLIAFGRDYVQDITDHKVWMIAHHPEWDGFLTAYFSGASRPEDRERFEQAWRKHIGPDQQNAHVLHHAAVFFKLHEPELAEALLERAIRAGTDTPLHLEGLGQLYGWAARRRRENAAFADYARSKLIAATDPFVLAGASFEIGAHNGKAMYGGELGAALRARIRELRISELPRLPSHFTEYDQFKCPFMPRLRAR
ncbi:MAG: hypothetical protein JNK87_19375 [Bryobacterales bacterium]|nr:hypothetical protein [Bryobacterales bacterium]